MAIMDAATIATGLQSLKTAFEIGKALLNLSISAEIKTRVIELNERILAAQESAIASRDYQSALLNQINQLEKQIAELQAWDAEEEKYELVNIRDEATTKHFGAAFARALKKDASAGEAFHLICAECFERHEKSVLQEEGAEGRMRILFCQRCRLEISRTGPKPDVSHWTTAKTRK